MIRIVYTASNTLFGKVIRYLTNSKVSHVMIQYSSDLWGGEWVAEATLPMVCKMPAEKARRNVVTEFECLFDAKPALHAIRDEIGKWYDFKLIFGLGFILMLWKFLKIKIRRPLGNSKGDICSEFVAKFYKAAKLPNSGNIVPSRYYPELSLNYNLAYPELFKQIDVAKTS